MSPRQKLNPDDIKAAASWVIETGRQNTAAAAKHFGWLDHYAARVMSRTQEYGIQKLRVQGKCSYWVTPAEAKKGAQESLERIRQARRERTRRAKETPKLACDDADWVPAQRIVPAAGAAPLAVRAPASVFHLGAMA